MSNDPILDAMRAAADDLDTFVQNYKEKSASATASRGDSDDLDAFVQNYKAGSASAVASQGDPDDLDAFVQSYQAPSPYKGIPRTPPATISPRTPTLGERIRNVFTYGAPPGSVLGNASGKVLQPGDEEKPPQLITPEAAMTPTEQEQHPVATGLSELAGGMTTPENVAIIAGTAGFGSMPGAAGRILPRLVSGVFSAQMLKGAYDQYPEFKAAVDRGDYSDAKRIATLIVGGAAMGVAAGAHAFRGGPTVGAGEQLLPERPETLQAQVDALGNGTNKAVYFPKGQQNIPEPPENANVTVVNGNKPGAGTWYHTEDIAPEDIRAAVKDGSYGKLLGFSQTKEEAAANGKPAAVVARDANGTELKAGLADATSPQAIAEQAAELTRQFPGSKIGIEAPGEVIAKRQASTTMQESSTQQGPVSRETPPQSASPEVLTDQLRSRVSAIEGKLAAGQPVTTDEVAELHGLSDRLEAAHETARGSEQAAGTTSPVPGQEPLGAGAEVAQHAESVPRSESATGAPSTEVPEPVDHILAAMRASGESEGLKTDALRRLIGRPEGEAEPSFEPERAGGRETPEPEGTLYSGVSPAALKRLIPESVREKVGEEVEANQRARRLQGGLYDLDSQNAADVLRARDVLKEAPGTPADQTAIYHHLENPDEPLTATQHRILDGYIKPLLDESERINAKLGGGQVENYVHRIPIGKGSRLERILGGESQLSAGGGLSKAAGSTKGRVMMALEDEEGERSVVAIKGGKVTAFENGQPEDLGRIHGLESQGLKTKGELLSKETQPMERELAKLEAERQTLTATKSREAASRRRIANIDDRAAELREAIQDAHRTDQGDLVSENNLRDRVFVDKNGKQWKITQATTKEIEAATNQRYYKNALASSLMNFLNLRKAERAYDFLEAYKKSPDFKQVAAKVGEGAAPAGWRTTDLPQFHGYVFQPHTGEVLDWYAKRMRAEGPGLYQQVGNFLRTAIFFNPLIHTPNIGVHWLVEKGVTGVGPQNWARILRTGSRAIDAVIHQNQDFLDALDKGAPLQSARLERDSATQLLIDRMGRELDANPTAAKRFATALGFANPARLVKAIYRFSGKATWVTNDIAMLQATYEHMERTGQPFKEAITDVSKHIPDYRLPTRIFDSPGLAKVMSNPNLTMFGAYHYGALRSYGEMAKGLISEDVLPAERAKALDRLAMLGLVTFVAYPQLDKLAKYMTGDKTAEFRRAGASTFIWNLAQLAKGNRTPADFLESVATPAVHTKALAELALDRNLYTGRKIYDPSAPAGDVAKQIGRYAANAIAPVGQAARITEGRQTIPQFTAGLAGIRTKVKTPAERLASTLAMDRSPLGPGNEDQREASQLARNYEDKIRSGEMPTQGLGKAVQRGELTEDQAVRILRNSKTSPLARDFKRLPIEDALKVWNKASTDERKTLRPILETKVWNLNLDNYAPKQKQALFARIRTALTGKIPTQPTAPWPGMKIPIAPPGAQVGAQ